MVEPSLQTSGQCFVTDPAGHKSDRRESSRTLLCKPADENLSLPAQWEPLQVNSSACRCLAGPAALEDPSASQNPWAVLDSLVPAACHKQG